MKILMTLAVLGALAAFAAPSFAQGTAPAPATKAATAPAAVPAAAPNAQQERMKECNTKAEGKKGDERKAYMAPPVITRQPAARARCTSSVSSGK